jgi:osmotically-inducible protein OsmY
MLFKPAVVAVLALGAFAACKSRTPRESPTADHAVSEPSDLATTQKIRRAIMEDSSLSINGHNCKIIVQNGKATLVGPVASPEESARIAKIAADVVGEDNVSNELEATK